MLATMNKYVVSVTKTILCKTIKVVLRSIAANCAQGIAEKSPQPDEGSARTCNEKPDPFRVAPK